MSEWGPMAGLSYAGETLIMIDETSVIHISGNGVKIMSTVPSDNNDGRPRDRFIWGGPDVLAGISALDFNGPTKRIAFCPVSETPEIRVHSMTNHGHLYNLRGGAELSYVNVAFTRNGKHLASLSGLPDFRFIVWNLETKSKVAGADNALPFPCSIVTPHPLNDTWACTSGEEGIAFWQGTVQFNKHKYTATVGKRLGIDSTDRPRSLSSEQSQYAEEEDFSGSGDDEGKGDADGREQGEEELLRLKNGYTSQLWALDNTIVAVNRAGELVQFNFLSGDILRVYNVPATPPTVLQEKNNDQFGRGFGGDSFMEMPVITETAKVTAVMLTKHHIVCACTDGNVRWVTVSEPLILDTAQTSVEYTASVGGLEVEAVTLIRGEGKQAEAGRRGGNADDQGPVGPVDGDGNGSTNRNAGSVVTMAPSPFYSVFALGTLSGGVFTMPVEVPSLEEESEETTGGGSRSQYR